MYLLFIVEKFGVTLKKEGEGETASSEKKPLLGRETEPARVAGEQSSAESTPPSRSKNSRPIGLLFVCPCSAHPQRKNDTQATQQKGRR
jgi:hypothetical protein